MKFRWFMMSCLLLALIVSACQAGEAPVEPQGAYPAPAGAYPQPQGAVPYPLGAESSEEGQPIEWGQAEAIIMNGAVAQITQTHDGEVILRLHDGVVFVTQQPQVDDVLKVIERCGELCQDILVATE